MASHDELANGLSGGVLHGEAPDLVKRDFTADRPNALRVMDRTYVAISAGMVYVASSTCSRARSSVGPSRRTCRPGWSSTRSSTPGSTVVRSSRVSSVTPTPGRKADSTGSNTTELIRRQGPWRTVDDVELATLQWVRWFNTERLRRAMPNWPSSRTPPVQTQCGVHHLSGARFSPSACMQLTTRHPPALPTAQPHPTTTRQPAGHQMQIPQTSPTPRLATTHQTTHRDHCST